MEKVTLANLEIGMKIVISREAYKGKIPPHNFGLVTGKSVNMARANGVLSVLWYLNDMTVHQGNHNIFYVVPTLEGPNVFESNFGLYEDLDALVKEEVEVDISCKEGIEVWNAALETVIDQAVDWHNQDGSSIDVFIENIENLKK